MKATIDEILLEATRIYNIARPNPEKRITNAECIVMSRLEHEYLESIGADHLIEDEYGKTISGTQNWYTIERPAGQHPGGIWAGGLEEALLKGSVWPDRREAVSVFLDPDCSRYHELSDIWTAEQKRAEREARLGSGDMLAMLGDWDS